MKRTTYSTAFSAGGSLLFKEAEALVRQIDDVESFILSQKKLDYSALPVNSEASKKRLGNEVVKRLRSLEDSQLIERYINGSKTDKLLILFYAACKQYLLITEFMLDTVLNKWHHLDFEIGAPDFKNYLYKQMDKHHELENLSPLSISKLSSAVMTMLKELGMNKDGKLHKKEFSPTILRRIAANGDAWFLEALLMNEAERNEIINP